MNLHNMIILQHRQLYSNKAESFFVKPSVLKLVYRTALDSNVFLYLLAKEYQPLCQKIVSSNLASFIQKTWKMVLDAYLPSTQY